MLLSQMLKRKVSLPPGGKARIDCLHSHVLCSFLVTARAVCVPVSFEAFHVRIAGCCFVGITVIRRGPVTFRAFAAFALLPFHAGLLQSDQLLESRCSPVQPPVWTRSEEHTSELQSLMRISYAVFCLK